MAANDFPLLSVKRSPYGDCVAIRNAVRSGDEGTWTTFSEEGEWTDLVDHDDVVDWPDLTLNKTP